MTHVFIQTNESPIDALTNVYGDRLQMLDDKRKFFIAAVLVLYLSGLYALEGAIDELDPEAQYPDSFISLVEGLEKQTRHDLLCLVGAIATELAWRND